MLHAATNGGHVRVHPCVFTPQGGGCGGQEPLPGEQLKVKICWCYCVDISSSGVFGTCCDGKGNERGSSVEMLM